MNRHALTATLALLGIVGVAHADVFGMAPGIKNLDTVVVGDPGNTSDARYGGHGAVDRPYKIGKYEVTTAQYVEFLNAVAKTDTHGLYNTDMWCEPYNCRIQRTGAPGSYSYNVASDFANRPMTFVGYWDACRFCNWLHNGQPVGAQDAATTEDGAYTLNGYDGNNEPDIRRNPGAKWFLPNENEWYKAAYYKGGSQNAGYWEYPTKSDTIDHSMANYGESAKGTVDVGTYAFPGPYGTYDQGGNVNEWNEVSVGPNGFFRGLRGGGFSYGRDNSYYLRASTRDEKSIYPTFVQMDIGFRVAGAIDAR